MNCNLSRSQKTKANNIQKGILSVIAEQEKRIRNGEELSIWAEKIAILADYNTFTVDEAIDLITVAYFGQVILDKLKRIANKNNDNTNDFEFEYNTSNLYIGQVVPNYKELCKLLEVKPKTGKSRRLQEKDFYRYFDYEKLKFSNEYYILDIYEPDEIISKNINSRNSLYINQLIVLILLLISTQAEKNNQGNKELKTTFPRLRKQMNIVNFNYDTYKNKDLYSIRKKQHIHLSDSEAEYQEKLFRLHAEEKFKNSIRTALNHLEDSDILCYDTYTVICYYDDEDKERFRQATPDEEMYIHNIKQEAAQQLGYTLSLYASRFKQKEFEKIIRNRIKKDKKWHYIFNGIGIISNDKALSTPIKKYTIFKDIDYSIYDVSKELQNSLRYEYNGNLVNSLHKKISKSRENKEQKLLKWYKEKAKFQDEHGNDLTDEDYLNLIIPQHNDMQHYTDDCNRYRDLLVDTLIKLDDKPK